MNVKLLLALLIFISQFGFSQTRNYLKGVVSSENFLIYNVDVINKNSRNSTTTNEKGEFVIPVIANDSLLFYSKGFVLKRLKISSKQIELNNLEVIMLKNAEELDEVVITKTEDTKFNKEAFKAWEHDKREEIKVKKADDLANNRTVYDGTIDNGMDFVGIAKKIYDLFTKNREPKRHATPEIDFATLAINTCNQEFFTKNLKLKREEILLFLQFCDEDPKSKKVKEHTNILSMMDFLTIKNKEFQKLNEVAK
jgi:hypothetical protein